MKKLFGHNKSKTKPTTTSRDVTAEEHSVSTPIHQQHATYLTKPSPQHKQKQLEQQQQQQRQQLQQQIPQPPLSSYTPTRNQSGDEERWEVVAQYADGVNNPKPISNVIPPSRSSSFHSIPAGNSPSIPSPILPRSVSPAMTNSSVISNKPGYPRDRDRDIYQPSARKKQTSNAPVALGILRALDPPRAQEVNNYNPRSHSEEQYAASENGHSYRDVAEKKEKRGFWSSGKDKEKDRERERERERIEREQRERERERDREKEKPIERERDRGRDQRRDIVHEDNQAELTRMIGYLTATASEDWALVLDVCDRASAGEANAKEAVRALRREFKYGEPPAQLSAARLWAIMLRNSSDIFVMQSRSRKFLDTLEELLQSSRTSPVVRERLLEVVAAAAFASRTKTDGFKVLWRKVKPFDKPDEGIPFDSNDAMFNPPASGRLSAYEVPVVSYRQPSPVPLDSVPPTPPPVNLPRKRKSPTRNRIIPPEEDMRRLLQECKIGQGNAALLSQALALSKPEDLKRKDIIKEFYLKCRASQELIFAQIDWASAGAERSRLAKDQERAARKRTFSTESKRNGVVPDDGRIELTVEEKLLAALLAANAELMEALKQYDDLARIAEERKAEERSRKDVRMDRRYLNQDPTPHDEFTGGSSSRSPSPPSRSHSPYSNNLSHPRPHHLPLDEYDYGIQASTLAPPPSAPQGPRSQAQHSVHSRTPSPGTPNLDPYTANGYGNGYEHHEDVNSLYLSHDQISPTGSFDNEQFRTPNGPSAKALGKRKVVETATLSGSSVHSDDLYFDKDNPLAHDDHLDSDDESTDGRWHHPPIQYVYDAAAERTQQILKEGQAAALLVNGVH